MTEFLTSPAAAFAIYLLLGILILGVGRLLAGPRHPSAKKSSVYASGEAPPRTVAVPGYRAFFVIALFFAVLHLGVLIVGSSPPSLMTVVYIGGLFITLLAMLIG